MAPIDRFQASFSTDLHVVLIAVCVLVFVSVMTTVWFCICCDGSNRESGDAIDEAESTPGGSKQKRRRKHVSKAKNPKMRAPKKMTFASVVVFNDGRKGRLTKDGTKPRPFTQKMKATDDGKKKGDVLKNSQLPKALQSTGLSPPPSLHVPGQVSEGPTSKVALDDVKTKTVTKTAIMATEKTATVVPKGDPAKTAMVSKQGKCALVIKQKESAVVQPKGEPVKSVAMTKLGKTVAVEPMKAATVVVKQEAEPVKEPKGEESVAPAAVKTVIPAAKTVMPTTVIPVATKTTIPSAAKTTFVPPAKTTVQPVVKTTMQSAAKTVMPKTVARSEAVATKTTMQTGPVSREV